MNECELFLTVVSPNLYEENPFRILGLTINASAKDIVRKTRSLETKIDLNIEFNADDVGVLPLKNPPNKDSIKKAYEDIRNPAARIIYELFWFWPLQQSNDEGLSLLSKGRCNEALTFWRKREDMETIGSIAKHNVAILYHLTALDLERKIAADIASQTEIDNCKSHWKSTLVRWNALVNDDRFWRDVEKRILSLDDIRVTIETVNNLRQTLPRALLQINGALAANAAKRTSSVIVQRQLQMMSESGFDDNINQHVLRDVTKPIIEQIQLLCSPILEKAKQSPQEANKIVRVLLNEIKPLLGSLDLLMPFDSSFKERCYDDVATTLRGCVIIYGNETTDWDECLKLSYEIAGLAKNTWLKNLLKEDINFIDKNIEIRNKNERLFGGLKPINKAPSLSTTNSIGFALYGCSDYDDESQSYLATYYFIFLAIPVFPICRYRVIRIENGYRFLGKAPLRSFDKWHLAVSIAIIAIVAMSIIFGGESGSSGSLNYTDNKSNYRNTTETKSDYLNRTTYDSQYDRQSLLSKINAGKSTLKKMEEEINDESDKLSSLSTRIKTLKSQAENYESDAARGAFVNEYSYQQVIDEHNKLVEQYNYTLEEYKEKSAEYEAELNRVNDLIGRYNRGSR